MLQSRGEKEGSAVLGQRPKSCQLSEDASYRSQGRGESGSSLYWESFDKYYRHDFVSKLVPAHTLDHFAVREVFRPTNAYLCVWEQLVLSSCHPPTCPTVTELREA
ncbi:hypothetical protein PHYPO_G00026260 [Pangasianodon hypophthalmus]|uniref:Uncharacterized protein n=1 Tax=Pangasianodon hypophthalmus TaxID=310915 RepID=A0A5N5MXU1_PANHP|nr:hypothetical protein PHYPO_G00026260 [Pangasianodon hypophthalmus]